MKNSNINTSSFFLQTILKWILWLLIKLLLNFLSLLIPGRKREVLRLLRVVNHGIELHDVRLIDRRVGGPLYLSDLKSRVGGKQVLLFPRYIGLCDQVDVATSVPHRRLCPGMLAEDGRWTNVNKSRMFIRGGNRERPRTWWTIQCTGTPPAREAAIQNSNACYATMGKN